MIFQISGFKGYGKLAFGVSTFGFLVFGVTYGFPFFFAFGVMNFGFLVFSILISVSYPIIGFKYLAYNNWVFIIKNEDSFFLNYLAECTLHFKLTPSPIERKLKKDNFPFLVQVSDVNFEWPPLKGWIGGL